MQATPLIVLPLALIVINSCAGTPTCSSVMKPAGATASWSSELNSETEPVLLREAFGSDSGSAWSESRLLALLDPDAAMHSSLRERHLVNISAYLSASYANNGEQLFSSAATGSQGSPSTFASLRRVLAPPHALRHITERSVASVGRLGTGSVMHRHKMTWFHLLAGRKTWTLLPRSVEVPHEVQEAHPCKLPALQGALVCTQNAGEVRNSNITEARCR